MNTVQRGPAPLEGVAERVENPYRGDVVLGAQPQGGAGEQALVGREVAEAQSAMILARRFPRNPVQAVDKILNECQRLSLAEKAQYAYARGGSEISGPSIRLAETIARHWGNMDTGFAEIARRQGFSECVAVAVDLETGYRVQKRFVVKHWRDTRSGGYEVTEERDIYELVANQGSRRLRACILSVVPGDVVERAIDQCNVTLRTKAEVTPERVKSMLEKFAEYGVTPAMIEKRIQRRPDTMLPAQLVSLGRIYTSLQDAMSMPGDWFDMALGAAQADAGEKPKGAAEKMDTLATKGKRAKPDPSPPAAQPAATTETAASEQKPIGAPTAGEITAAILRATTLEALNEQFDLARSLPEGERETVVAAAEAKRKQLAHPVTKPAAEGLFGDAS